MKRKDLVYLIASVLILVTAGYLGYGQLNHGSGSKPQTVMIEKVPTLSSNFNMGLLQDMADPTKIRDFNPVFDLTTGLGNPIPFGPF